MPHAPDDFVIRPLDLADPQTAHAAHCITKAAYAIEAKLIDFDGIPALHETLAGMRAHPLTWLGVLTPDGQLAAFVAYDRTTDPVEIDRVCVDPAWFRHGLASRLLGHLMDELLPAKDLTVSTGAANEPAIALYKRLGFARTQDFSPAPGLTMASFELRRP
ncbi:N-acetyltransferase [Streptomyces sp. UNOC14_S4]|uniref:GNAT family N-acetyltransferase n=1 Tax=Streptomyces sp. UNOC14_S4 TaxID=2872340 RepID=UPI001E32287E|nr:GNAT family N-acetyltransferase [Streptomyces sp. UNOC14_S4]MCC3771729.1 GNAT family N-acetyltransferase [Streptomyces sp. UNOC14_S4]